MTKDVREGDGGGSGGGWGGDTHENISDCRQTSAEWLLLAASWHMGVFLRGPAPGARRRSGQALTWPSTADWGSSHAWKNGKKKNMGHSWWNDWTSGGAGPAEHYGSQIHCKRHWPKPRWDDLNPGVTGTF